MQYALSQKYLVNALRVSQEKMYFSVGYEVDLRNAIPGEQDYAFLSLSGKKR